MSATSGDCFNDQQRRKAEVIMRQTNYTMDEAIEQLQQHTNDPFAVIKAYMGVATNILGFFSFSCIFKFLNGC